MKKKKFNFKLNNFKKWGFATLIKWGFTTSVYINQHFKSDPNYKLQLQFKKQKNAIPKLAPVNLSNTSMQHGNGNGSP